MMEKRNFVTSARTPMKGASDIDDIVAAGRSVFDRSRRSAASALEKKAAAEDEKSDLEM